MSKIVKYNSVLTAGFNLYNACDVDYFNMAIGTNFQSVSGLMNFGTNILYRIYSDENTIALLNTGLTSGNPVTVGTAFG